MFEPVENSGSLQIPKHRLIADALAALVANGRLQPGARLPTEPELARRFHVSPLTIRQAKLSLIRRGILVSTRRRGTFVTQDAVLARVLVLSAVDVLTRGNDGLQLILHHLHQNFADRMTFRHFTASASSPRRRAMQDKFVGELREFRPQAVLTVGKSVELEACCVQEGIPLVGMHQRTNMLFVGVDPHASFRTGVEYLLARGARDIACMGEHGISATWSRLKDQYSIDWPQEWVAEPKPGHSSMYESEQFGHRAFIKMWGLARRPKGLLVLDDGVLKGAVLAMAELGVKPGRDITLVSLFNKGSRLYVPVPFARIEVDIAQYAARIAGIIDRLVADPHAKLSPVLIKPRLVQP